MTWSYAGLYVLEVATSPVFLLGLGLGFGLGLLASRVRGRPAGRR